MYGRAGDAPAAFSTAKRRGRKMKPATHGTERSGSAPVLQMALDPGQLRDLADLPQRERQLGRIGGITPAGLGLTIDKYHFPRAVNDGRRWWPRRAARIIIIGRAVVRGCFGVLARQDHAAWCCGEN